MFRLWGKMWKDRHLLKEYVYEREVDDTRTHMIFQGLEKVCYEMDLEKPMWLDSNVKDFKEHSKARFNQDSFIESIDFDYLEIEILSED